MCRLLGLEGSAFNPGLPESIASGTASGVALAVAADAATIGLGIDHLSGIRVSAGPVSVTHNQQGLCKAFFVGMHAYREQQQSLLGGLLRTDDSCVGRQVQAACSGLWGYRASTNAGPKEGVASLAGPLDALGWITRDPALLCKVGKAMQLPGGEGAPGHVMCFQCGSADCSSVRLHIPAQYLM